MAHDDIRALPAFVINLDDRPERWAQAQKEFARLDWLPRRWSGVRYTESPNCLSAGHAGCLESHRQIWRHVLDNALPFAAIFEDDVVLAEDFKDIFLQATAKLPRKWDVVHFHSSLARAERYTQHLVQITGGMWGSHGYMVSAAGCEKLLTIAPVLNVDVCLSHALAHIGGAVFGFAQHYTLCFQRGESSDIPETAQLGFWRKQLSQYGHKQRLLTGIDHDESFFRVDTTTRGMENRPAPKTR